MKSFIKLFSEKELEIINFIKNVFDNNINNINVNNININTYSWSKTYDNPIEITDIIGIFAENYEKYNLTMWICLDKDILINITDENADKIIRYMFERYPY